MINDKLPYLRSAFDAELETADAQAVVAMSPENFLHATGVYVASQRMIRERLALAIFPRGAAPFAVVSSVVVKTVARDSWIEDVVAWAEHEETPIEKLAAELERRGLLAPEISVHDAADTMYAMAADESVFLRLTRDCGWAPDRYADLIARTLQANLGRA